MPTRKVAAPAKAAAKRSSTKKAPAAAPKKPAPKTKSKTTARTIGGRGTPQVRTRAAPSAKKSGQRVKPTVRPKPQVKGKKVATVAAKSKVGAQKKKTTAPQTKKKGASKTTSKQTVKPRAAPKAKPSQKKAAPPAARKAKTKPVAPKRKLPNAASTSSNRKCGAHNAKKQSQTSGERSSSTSSSSSSSDLDLRSNSSSIREEAPPLATATADKLSPVKGISTTLTSQPPASPGAVYSASDHEDVFVMSPAVGWSKRRDVSSARPSVQLISKAAAARPDPSPNTVWICLSSDDESDESTPGDLIEIDDCVEQLFPAQVTAERTQSSMPPPSLVPSKRTANNEVHSISKMRDIFRDASALDVVFQGGFDLMSPPPFPPPAPAGHVSPTPLPLTQSTQPLPPSTVLMRDVLPPTFRARKASSVAGGYHIAQRLPPPPGAVIVDVDADDLGTELTQQLHSPTVYQRAVAQLRHQSSSEISPAGGVQARKPIVIGSNVSQPAPAGAKRGRADESTPLPPLCTPNKYSEGRPVDVLKPLFPTTFTRQLFLDTVTKVVSKPHCLRPGEFWDAFQSIEYVGEGSFGIVWRCVTLDGDEVAVKSCPISFDSTASIDDGFSVLREIAVMRFLNEQKVPYILPLHNAFFVEATEALPPHVAEALCYKSKYDEELDKRKKVFYRKHGRGSYAAQSLTDEALNLDPHPILTPDEDALLQSTKLPKFFAIGDIDALECDSTLFLVTELCDGDVEGIERSEAVSRGVAYCVSSALEEMHRLGLIHLDLKPSNILYAFDRQCANNSAVRHSAVAGATKQASIKFYLSDFGNCQVVGPGYNDVVNDAVGTYEYMDTLALQHKVCSRATDCFSLGCTLYELLTCTRLLEACREKKCKGEHDRLCYVKQSMGPFAFQDSPGQVGVPSCSMLFHVTKLLLQTDRLRRLSAAGCRKYLNHALGVRSHEDAANVGDEGGVRGGPEALTGGSAERKVSTSVKKRFLPSLSPTVPRDERRATHDEQQRYHEFTSASTVLFDDCFK